MLSEIVNVLYKAKNVQWAAKTNELIDLTMQI